MKRSLDGLPLEQRQELNHNPTWGNFLMLISKNMHYCAMSQKLVVLAAILNRIFFFSSFMSKMQMFSCFQLWAKFYCKNSFGKVVFQILVTWLLVFGRHFETKRFWSLFLLIHIFFGVYTYDASLVSYRNFDGTVLKNECVQVDPLFVHKCELKVA